MFLFIPVKINTLEQPLIRPGIIWASFYIKHAATSKQDCPMIVVCVYDTAFLFGKIPEDVFCIVLLPSLYPPILSLLKFLIGTVLFTGNHLIAT